jgi:ABC-type microcin C transport system permease subunit YejB
MRYTTATSEKALLKEVKAGAKYARATGGRVVVSYVAALRARFGLDQPLWVQFQHYAFNLLRLDLGYSFKDNMPVAALIADKLAATAILMIASLGTAFLLGIGLGTLAAVLALIGYATPEALLGICWRKHQKLLARDHFLEFVRASSLLKNLEMESFLVLVGRCWSGAVELDVIF